MQDYTETVTLKEIFITCFYYITITVPFFWWNRVVIVIDLFRILSNTINKKSINKFKIRWKLEEGKKPYHQAPTQLH